MSDGKFEELTQSPYEDDDGEGRPGVEEISWKVPVVAAVLGALVMAGYVIFAVATGPSDDSDVAHVDSDETAEVETQTNFPLGYSGVSQEVAVRSDVAYAGSDGSVFLVSSVVEVGVNPEQTVPPDVATWSLVSAEGTATIGSATLNHAAPGAISVRFGPSADPYDSKLVASLPGIVSDSITTISVDSSPFQLVDQEITGDGYLIVIDEITITENGGSFEWHIVEGIVAKVDVVVMLDSDGGPPSFTTVYNPTNEQLLATAVPPPWAVTGRGQLVGSFEVDPESSGAGDSVATGATIEFIVSVVTELGDTVEVSVQSVQQP